MDHGIGEGTLRNGLDVKSKTSHYSARQLSLYLDRIGYTPKEHSDENLIADGLFPANLENLGRLIPLHLLAFPFENTAMHYTPEHAMELEPHNLYRRLMDERKGSYCLGHNSFFLYVLRGLGYRAYNIVGKVNIHNDLEPIEYPPQGHLLILVQPIPSSNITYLVDVGFGLGPTRPILLTDSDKSVISGTTSSERFRLQRRADPRTSLESHQCYGLDWVLETQHVNSRTPDPSTAPWMPRYSFSEAEFYENDIYNASVCVCSSLHGKIFQHNVFVVKLFLLDTERNLIFDADKIATELAANGDVSRCDFGRAILLGRKLTFTRGGESEIRMLETEDERIGILKDVFDIMIKDEEKEYIKGLPSAL
ncbi:hypothetical protein JOM56_005513 [Amanita muscaria]